MLPLIDFLKILGVVIVWGLSFAVIKIGVAEAPPLMLTALRFVFSCLPAIFFLPRPKVPLATLAGYGIAIGVVQFGLLFTALKLGAPAGLSSLVIQLQIFFTIGLSAMVFGDRAGPAQMIGAAVALVGAGVVGVERVGGAAFLPMTLVVAAAVAWGIGNVIGKTAGRVDMVAFVVWSSLFVPLPLVALSLVLDGPAALAVLVHPSLAVYGAAAFLGWIATNLGFGLWSAMLARHPAAVVAPFALLVPVFGFLGGYAMFGERLTVAEIIGAALIFLGLAVNIFGAYVRARWLRRRRHPVVGG